MNTVIINISMYHTYSKWFADVMNTVIAHTLHSDHFPYGLVCYEHCKVLLLPCAALTHLYDTELSVGT
jgi:hypothetical protein